MGFDIQKLKQIAVPVQENEREKAEQRFENRESLRYSALIALAVRRELRLRGITQQNLAEQMGVSAQYLGKILKGRENLTLDTIGKLERVLGRPLIQVQIDDNIPATAFQPMVYCIEISAPTSSGYSIAPYKKSLFRVKW